MKRIVLLLTLTTLIVSCAPGKKSTPTYVDIYCNSCNAKVVNEWNEKETKTRVFETPFEGVVTGYKRVEFYRFDSPNSCVRPYEIDNYSTDTTIMYIIENNDSIKLVGGGAGFCY